MRRDDLGGIDGERDGAADPHVLRSGSLVWNRMPVRPSAGRNAERTSGRDSASRSGYRQLMMTSSDR